MQAVIQYIEKELESLYPKTEIEGFTRICIEHVFGYNFTQFILHKNEKIGNAEKEKIEAIIQRLKKNEPIQYILGETEFYGLKLKVNPAVLIPRPETEELVEWILESGLKTDSQIIDIGTGSGCIVLAIKNKLSETKTFAVDFSRQALNTASQNAKDNKLDVVFIEADILKWEKQNWELFDVIVSNPPYIRELEKEKMLPNVLNFEPESALFVPNSDSLIFYRRIAEFASKQLNHHGFLFFEINENLGLEMIELLEKKGFKNITVKKDLHGKDRMIRCFKP